MIVHAQTSAHENLSAILDYIEAMEKAGSSPPREIPDESLIGRGDEISSLPGVSLDPGPDAWLAVSRLGKVAPPQLPAELAGFVRLSDDPWREPALDPVSAASAQAPAHGAVGESGVDPEPLDRGAILEAYLEGSWRPWSGSERPRRRSMAVYQKLFHLHLNQGDEGPLELLMGAGDASWDLGGTRLRYPLFTQSCLLSFDPRTAVVSVGPSSKQPRFESDAMEELGAPGLGQFQQDEWKLYLRALQGPEEGAPDEAAEPLPEFAPHRSESHRQIVERAVHCLCADGEFDPRSMQAPAPARRLRATLGWTLFTRKSTNHFLIQDLRRLREELDAMRLRGDELPEAARAFVTDASSAESEVHDVEFRGTSSSGAAPGARELYFPMPYNDEQVRIVQLLETSPGVVVQGPPGTGKSHTIANIICHYMANGKRVLVTSKGEPALKVIKDKMPPGLRELCVALLSGDEEGAKQFEQSIGLIVNEVSQIDVAEAGRDVERMKAGIDALHARVALIDSGLHAAASAHGASVPFMGRSARVEEVAAFVVEAEADMGWMRHGRAPGEEPGDEQAGRVDRLLAVWSGAREICGFDFPALLAHVEKALPGLPSSSQLSECAELARRRAALVQDVAKEPLAPEWTAAERAARVDGALAQVRKAASMIGACPAGSEPPVAALMALAGDEQQGAMLKGLCASLAALDKRQLELDAMDIEMPRGAELDAGYRAAAGALAAGRAPFGLALFGEAKRVKLMAQATRILGAAPDAAGWAAVAKLCAHLQEGKKALAAWGALAVRLGVAKNGSDAEALGARVARAKSAVHDVASQAAGLAEARAAGGLLRALFGRDAAPPESLARPEALAAIAGVLERHAGICRLDEKIEERAREAEGLRGQPLFEQGSLAAVRELVRRAVDGEFDEASTRSWEALRERALALEGARVALEGARELTRELQDIGCGDWAVRLAAAPVAGERAESFAKWRQAWRWRAWSNGLDALPGHAQVRGLLAERRQVEDMLAEAYREIVVKKTWIEVRGVCTDDVKQKLKSYLSAMRSIGKGTGKRAERFRSDARSALEKARKAICCWIMPHWRVSESMPSEIGVFDLVIVDEASQSDIWALPAILRAKKILIVGDPKQVSPSAVGVAEDQILQLRARHLARQPHRAQMTQDKSIYDLGDVVFAASYVMLKEHFRCAPAIVEFSNREFYGGEIAPMRIPKATDCAGAPLVDLWVKNGFRDASDANPPEAWAIVDEIKALIANPDFDGKTMGVVTLLGSNQKGKIDGLLRQALTDEQYMARKIRVGSPEQFQGDERDVMFVSNVLARSVDGQRGAKLAPVIGMSNLEGNKQRLNVAMSRARDRVYLVRSIGLSDLSSDQSLTGKLFRHFSEPFAQDAGRIADLEALCESEFERQVFGELARAGYRAIPQFQVGRSRVDFVVEGDDGSRVAVECDGDRYHGGDDWIADLRRQRVMERAGWVFWRSFASAFARDRAGVVADMKSFLAAHGVFPTSGGQTPRNAQLVESRSVSPELSRPG